VGTITQDPLRPEALAGLKDPRALLTALNRLQAETGAILNGGATIANDFRLVVAGIEVVTPDDWTQLAPANGFTDVGVANGYGPFSVRKEPGGTAWIQGIVKRAAGAPALFTEIAPLPAGFAPQYAQRRPGESTGLAFAVWDVSASGSVRYLAGNPTNDFHVSGSWVAVDKSLPPWPKPVGVRLTDERVGSTTQVRAVVAGGRSSDGSAGLPSVASFPGAFIRPPARPGEPRLLVLPRIDGLRPLTRYALTLWVFLE
jgi:hypothetical protein